MVAFLIQGCAKDRADQFSDGYGQDLQEISHFDAKNIELQTGEIVSENPASEAQKLELDPSSELVNLPLVSLVNPPAYLRDVAVRGMPNRTVKIETRVTNKYFEVYRKVEKVSELSIHELPMAKPVPGGYLSPIVFYPIDLIKVRRSKNSQGEETNELIEEHVDSKGKAGSFKIDLRDRASFSSGWDKDVYPKEILNLQQEWIFVPTIIHTSEGLKSLQGRQFNYDFNWQEVSRVRIIAESNRLRLVTLNLDPNLPVDAKNATTVLEIPTTWVDFKQEDIGQTDLAISPNDDIDWQQKRFMKIAFKQSVFSLFNLSSGQDLKKVRIEKDYLAFDVSYPDQGVDIRYALFKAPEKKIGKKYLEEDEKSFGLFKIEQSYLSSVLTPRSESKAKHTYMARFYPENNTITYFLSEESGSNPETLKIARDAIKNWNDTFKKIGSQIQVVLREDRRVPLGDARFNTINLVESVAQNDWLLGYGPSVIDTSSGEIISATTNLYLGPIKEILRYQIKDFIKLKRHGQEYNNVANKLERLLSRHRPPEEVTPSGTANVNLGANESTNSEKFGKFANSLFSFPQSRSSLEEKISQTQIDIKNPDAWKKWRKNLFRENDGPRSLHTSHKRVSDCSFDLSQKNFFHKIEKVCPEITNEIGQSISSLESGAVEKCVARIYPEVALSTLVHELGHNFGLRHNFMGSADKSHYPQDVNQHNEKIETSSVMDYLDSDAAESTVPLAYDQSAIAFAYENKILDTNGQWQKLKSNELPLANQVPQAEKFLFCTDEQVGVKDPLCARFDRGSSLTEKANAIISQYKSRYPMSYFKYDEWDLPSENGLFYYNVATVFLELKNIYDHWRNLVYEKVGKEDSYLDSLKLESIDGVIKSSPKMQDAKQASDLIFDFLIGLISIPNQSCLVDGKDGLAFLNPSDLDLNLEDVSAPFNCQSVLGHEKVLKLSNENPVVEDVGLPVYDQYSGVRWPYLEKTPVAHGLWRDQYLAMVTLMVRIPTMNLNNWEREFAPNFFDQPEYAERISKYFRERLVEGVHAEDYAPQNKQFTSQLLYSTYVPFFKKDGDMLGFYYNLFLNGLNSPKSLRATLLKQTPYQFSYERQDEAVSGHAACLKLTGLTLWICADKDNNFSLDILKKAIDVEQRINTLESSGKNGDDFKLESGALRYQDIQLAEMKQKQEEEEKQKELAAASDDEQIVSKPKKEVGIEEEIMGMIEGQKAAPIKEEIIPFDQRFLASIDKIAVGETYVDSTSLLTVEKFMQFSSNLVLNTDLDQDVVEALRAMLREELIFSERLNHELNQAVKEERNESSFDNELSLEERAKMASASFERQLRAVSYSSYIVHIQDNFQIEVDLSRTNLQERARVFLRNRLEKQAPELKSQLDLFYSLFFY